MTKHSPVAPKGLWTCIRHHENMPKCTLKLARIEFLGYYIKKNYIALEIEGGERE
jgi:hypothetical protein